MANKNANKIQIPTDKIILFFTQLPKKIGPFLKQLPNRIADFVKNFPSTFQRAPTDEKIAYGAIAGGFILFLLGMIL
ncbi:MAG TPA: hypothetical protein VJC00_01940 [Candidatus Nanoarchaeia archaeon]|nr:hypothetical protein [Candidatus Nanoarchaeia archaeon]